MRFLTSGLALTAAAVLAACTQQVPDSGAGVGFNEYDSYVARREAELRGQSVAALPPAQAVSSETLGSAPAGAPMSATGGALNGTAPATTGGDSPSDIARETQAALAASSANSGQTPVQADPNNPPPEAVNSFGISRENDFGAVGEQRSIEDDKQRIASVRSQYQQVQPTALPERTDTGPNLVTYALSTNNQPGQKVYSRSGFTSAERSRANCGRYASPDLAQSDFLKSGGPERDRKGLDPDGDGFACTWDPRPFRNARG
ncbi:hypothetical protein ATO6_07520 [Oceanicola sp. 22II-s10i]|uniref:hypothetical protein n=1 Tax=Oceanicola sp. 22II-s10i TaxID=1317116 RepID=UPI000B522DA2|nr:hypothetical protein [Oceanicola sp. 22II-s10i]OWU86620.1 hypothetical protein ATO6_07520 [Oceanicola sp. 22II-s10i]